jgi:hypothetical protein
MENNRIIKLIIVSIIVSMALFLSHYPENRNIALEKIFTMV